MGIDPGLANLGLARLELHPDGERVTGLEVVRTQPSPRKAEVLAASDSLRRLGELHRALETWITPDVVCIASESMSWPRNAGAAVKVAMTWGLVAALAARHGLPIVLVSPQDLKRRLTGSRTATKEAVQRALERRYGAIQWPEPPSIREHAADALGAVVACLDAPAVLMARRLAHVAGVAP